MINIAICDDSSYIRKKNLDIITKYSIQKDLDCNIEQFESGEELLERIDDFELVFLDYQFEDKGADGMVIAREIRKRNAEVTIVFLSSYTNVVFETFEVRTFRFIDKPLTDEKLNSVMDAFLESIKKDNSICIKSYGEKRYIKVSQISFVEGDGKYCKIHLINKKEPIDCVETLSAVEEKIDSNDFFRCHKSFLINLKYVDSFTHSDLVMQDEALIAISRQKYKQFSEVYAEYMAK